MFTIIAAMAELESSLISERVNAGMKAAAVRGKYLGRPPLAPALVSEIRELAASTNLSIREIHKKSARKRVEVGSERLLNGYDRVNDNLLI